MRLKAFAPEHRQISPQSQLLNPEQFKARFFQDLESARDYVLVKSFLWRNDLFGTEVALKLLEAANRGTKIIILKDQLGALYEFAEPNGLSFFHDNVEEHLTHYIYGKIVSALYNYKVHELVENPLRQILSRHQNISIIEDNFHDHSKVVVIDDLVAYVKGINFGDEHMEDSNSWHDFAVRIEGREHCRQLLNSQAGLPTQKNSELVQFHHGEGDAMSLEMARFILDTRQQLTVFMAYMGDPTLTDALASVLHDGKAVKLIVPSNPSVNSGNNFQALHRLVTSAGMNVKNLNVVLSPDMGHGKGMLKDGRHTWIGSKNMATIGHLADTVVTVDDSSVAASFQQATKSIESGNAESLSGDEIVRKFSVMSPTTRFFAAMENLGTRFLEFKHILSGDEVAASRRRAQKVIRSIIA